MSFISLADTAYHLAPSPSSHEPISAAQYTYLKLYDAYIQSSFTKLAEIPSASYSFLVPAVVQITTFLSTTMQGLVDGHDGSAGGSPFSDLRFEKVYGALVVMLQCVLKIGLWEKDVAQRVQHSDQIVDDDGLMGQSRSPGPLIQALKNTGSDASAMTSVARQAVGKPCCPLDHRRSHRMRHTNHFYFFHVASTFLSVLLRLADVLEPRLIRTKPISEIPTKPEEGPKNFAYLRRDLVRVIGMLSYEDKKTQDLIREFGGLDIILSLCAMDETNPCELGYRFCSPYVLFRGCALMSIISIFSRDHPRCFLRQICASMPCSLYAVYLSITKATKPMSKNSSRSA